MSGLIGALLRVALTNLFENASRYCSSVVSPRIEFGAENSNGTRIYVVRDNGVGFDPAFADKLFLPFERLHDDDYHAGIGIGLAIVARVINRHRGAIWADGRPGEGAEFRFTLTGDLSAP